MECGGVLLVWDWKGRSGDWKREGNDKEWFYCGLFMMIKAQLCVIC